MGKNTDAVKPLDQWRAPWETESGSDAEIDKPKLKRYIHNLVMDKAKAQDARDEATEHVTELEKDLEEAKTEAAASNGEEAQKKIDRLTSQLAAAKQKVTDLETAKEESDLRAEVLEGIDPKVAKYVVGKTREELEASLEEVKKDFGIDADPNDDDDEDEEDDENVGRTTPRSRLRSVTDPAANSGREQEMDPDAVADMILSGGRLQF